MRGEPRGEVEGDEGEKVCGLPRACDALQPGTPKPEPGLNVASRVRHV